MKIRTVYIERAFLEGTALHGQVHKTLEGVRNHPEMVRVNLIPVKAREAGKRTMKVGEVINSQTEYRVAPGRWEPSSLIGTPISPGMRGNYRFNPNLPIKI